MSVVDKAVLKAFGAKTYPLTVHEVEKVNAHCLRVHIKAPELIAAEDVERPSFWLRLWIPHKSQEIQRAYTVTRLRRAESLFALDFVLHDAPGVASQWARTTAPGETLRTTVYTGKLFEIPTAAPGLLLIGDPASLPAINEILRALGDDVPARVLLQQQHDDDTDLEVHSDDVTWLPPNATSHTEAVRALDADLTGWHAWVATESSVTRQVKNILQKERGLDRKAIKAQGYWIEGKPMGRAVKDNA